MRTCSITALLIAAIPALALPISDHEAKSIAKPQEMIVDGGLSAADLAAIVKPVEAFYAFWNGGSTRLLSEAISPDFVDHNLPEGRPQGPQGPLVGLKGFVGVVPDLRVEILQRLIVGDRVTSLIHCTGHFTGNYKGLRGNGQNVDFISVDILRVRGGRITENWHLEDNLTFMRQIGAT